MGLLMRDAARASFDFVLRWARAPPFGPSHHGCGTLASTPPHGAGVRHVAWLAAAKTGALEGPFLARALPGALVAEFAGVEATPAGGTVVGHTSALQRGHVDHGQLVRTGGQHTLGLVELEAIGRLEARLVRHQEHLKSLVNERIDLRNVGASAFRVALLELELHVPEIGSHGSASASAAPGAGASAAPGTGVFALSGSAPTESLHTFTLDSGASRSFFRDSTTLTPLSRLVAVSLADPSGGPDLAHSSTVLPSPAAPSGLLSGLHLPSFSMNLVSRADLQYAWVDQFTPGGQRVTHSTCSWTGRHPATFTRRPGSSLYTLTTVPPPVSASGQIAASSQVFAAASRSTPASAPCSCSPLSHKTLLWHHRLGHPSLPRLRGMASRALVSGLPRSLPPLPPGPAPTCVPCVEGQQRAAPHSSLFPPTEAPLQTLHMDVWGPAHVRGQGHERYFLLVVDNYSRYTIVFPLRSKDEVPEVLIDWIRGARRQLSESFGSDLPVLRLHSDRGGEFSSDLLRAFCRSEGIRQTFTLPASPQQNGIAERRIGMINLQPRVSLPETTPTPRWTGKVGDASAFRVWGSRAFVRETTADKLSSRAVPCVFLGFPPDAPGWQFYHPTSRCVLSSQDVTFDESVSYYHPAKPVEVAVDSGAARGAERAGAGIGGAATGGAETGGAESGGADPGRVESDGTAPGGTEPVHPAKPVEVAVDSGAARGAERAGAGIGGAATGGAETGGAESGGADPGRVESDGTAPGGTEPVRAESGGALGVPLHQELLSPQQLREWYSRRCRGAAGSSAAGAAGGAAAAGAPGGAAGAGGADGAGTAGGAAGAGGVAGAGAAGGATVLGLLALPFLTSLFDRFSGAPFHHPHHYDAIIQVDASTHSWGATLSTFHGTPSNASAGMPDNLWPTSSKRRELEGVLWALRTFMDRLRHGHTLVRVDNQGVMFILRKGGLRNNELTLTCKEIITLCTDNVRLAIEWIPRDHNTCADELSKLQDHDDYTLKQPWFRLLDRRWGPHSVDLFANAHNTLLPHFFSKVPHPRAEAINAFSKDWHGERGFAFPPPHLVPATLHHARRAQAKLTL
ncbi:unnamed protein product, partial [Closterium sp. NIES-53]